MANYILFSTPHVLLDTLNRIIAVLAGRPCGDSSWDAVTRDATEAMEKARARCIFSDEDTLHLRGPFPTLKVGAAHGGGTEVCLLTVSAMLFFHAAAGSGKLFQ